MKPVPKTALVLVLVLIGCGYLLAGLLGIQAHTDPGEMDTTAYLSAAYKIRQTGGVTHHLQNCLGGVYREATQHPAYLLILSLFARQDVHFFVNAKIVTYFMGFLFLPVYFFTVRKIFGTGTGLLGLALVISSATFLHLSTMVACESLLAVFFMLFWFFAARGFEKPVFWLVAGFFASAAFLTKSLAILTIPIFLISVLILRWGRKKEIFLNKYFWGFFAVFFIFSSPLLLRNYKVFGTPFYSDSSPVLWMDRWRDYYRPDLKENPPTAAAYFKTHTFSQISSVFFQGLLGRDPRMISDGLKPFAFWEKRIDLKKLQGFFERTAPWQEGWAFFLFALALAGLWKARGSPAAVLAGVSLCLFLVFVAWYSKVFPGDPPTRLLYPVLFFVYVFAASLFNFRSERWAAGLAGIFAVLYAGSVALHFDWRNLDVAKSFRFRNPFLSELRWVDANARQGDVIMVGSVFTSYLFYFEPKIRAKIIDWPQVNDLSELESYARRESARYGILEMTTVVYNLKTYKPYFDVGPGIGLVHTADMPEFMRRIYTDTNRISFYEIYEFIR